MRSWTGPLAGVMLGSLLGYLYWYYIGCQGGTCPITASPVNSTIYGCVMGLLAGSSFRKQGLKQNKKS